MAIHSTASLRARGITKSRIADLVAEGTLVRVRRGLYADSESGADEIEAVRIGGALGCVSALRSHGVWVSRRTGLHVQLPRNASRLRPGAARRHWERTVSPSDLARVSVLDALLTAMLCQHPIDAVASVDSALHLGLVRMSDVRPHCSDARRRRILDLVDSRAESGLESIVRVALVLAGLRVESQVVIPGVGRVDLLVEGRVVVETDGAAFHRGPRRHVDYVRDAATVVGGLTALRFDAAQVLDDLPSVMRAVIAAVRGARDAPFSGREAEIALRRGERALRS